MAGKIFINYRREDSIAIAGRLHDRLAEAFGRDNLFMDIDSIPIGINFEEYLKREMADCDAVLSIIGPSWLNAKDETDHRRLDKPDDFVAIEIAIALASGIPVVPVLVDGTRMPKASELPTSLKPLALRNAIQLRNMSFGSDAERLIAKMREAIVLGKPERARGKAIVLLFSAQGVASFLLGIAMFFCGLAIFLMLPTNNNFVGGLAATVVALAMAQVAVYTKNLVEGVRKFGLAISVGGLLAMVAIIVSAQFFRVSLFDSVSLLLGCILTAYAFSQCAVFFIGWKKFAGTFNKRDEARWVQYGPQAMRLANSWLYGPVISLCSMFGLIPTWVILYRMTDSMAATLALVGFQLLMVGYCYYSYVKTRQMLAANPLLAL